MKTPGIIASVILATVLAGAISCQQPNAGEKKNIVVTYSVLGSVVRDLVGDAAGVTVSIPNGLDPHDWAPSAKDIETINRADLVIQNGLGLEEAMENSLHTASSRGVKFFTASDHITVRHVSPGEGIPSTDPDQAAGAPDPHLWLDPLTVKSVVSALAVALTRDLGLDVSERAAVLLGRLDSLNSEIDGLVSTVPRDNRKLVTGHESMGYFADRYGFKLVGVIVPGLSTQAEVSAADLAALKRVILENQVKSVFTELGTPPAVARAIAQETGARVVELTTHVLPGDGSYFTLMKNLATGVSVALK